MDTTIRIWDLVRSLRSERNIPEAQMATELGIPVSDYLRLEDGSQPLAVEILYQIAEILRLDPSHVMGIYMQSERERRKHSA